MRTLLGNYHFPVNFAKARQVVWPFVLLIIAVLPKLMSLLADGFTVADHFHRSEPPTSVTAPTPAKAIIDSERVPSPVEKVALLPARIAQKKTTTQTSSSEPSSTAATTNEHPRTPTEKVKASASPIAATPRANLVKAEPQEKPAAKLAANFPAPRTRPPTKSPQPSGATVWGDRVNMNLKGVKEGTASVASLMDSLLLPGFEASLFRAKEGLLGGLEIHQSPSGRSRSVRPALTSSDIVVVYSPIAGSNSSKILASSSVLWVFVQVLGSWESGYCSLKLMDEIDGGTFAFDALHRYEEQTPKTFVPFSPASHNSSLEGVATGYMDVGSYGSTYTSSPPRERTLQSSTGGLFGAHAKMKSKEYCSNPCRCGAECACDCLSVQAFIPPAKL